MAWEEPRVYVTVTVNAELHRAARARVRPVQMVAEMPVQRSTIEPRASHTYLSWTLQVVRIDTCPSTCGIIIFEIREYLHFVK